MKKTYHREELLLFLNEYYKEHGSFPKTRELDSCSDFPSAGVFRRVFGKYDNAIAETGIITLNKPRKNYTDDELLDAIRQFYLEFTVIPTVSTMDEAKGYPSTSVFTKRFGTLRNAVIKAGVSVPLDARRNYKEGELLNFLHDFVGEFNKVPTVEDMDEAIGYPSASTYRYRFGSLRTALIMAGIDLPNDYFVSYSNDELLEMLVEFHESFGDVTSRKLDESDFFPSSRTYWYRFGSLQNALEIVGIPVSYSSRISHSDEDLIRLLKKYNDEFGFPKYDDITREKGYPSASVYVSRFGSWEEALRAAGFDISEALKKKFERRFMTEEEILEHVRYHSWLKENAHSTPGLFNVLLIHLDITEIEDLPSTTVIFHKFGGIKNAYKRLGIDYVSVNKEYSRRQLVKVFRRLASYIKRVPTNPDIYEYSWYTGVSSTTFYNAFGTIYNMQKESGFEPLKLQHYRTKEELIQDLITLEEELGIVPTVNDLIRNKDRFAHPATYHNYFGSFVKALKEAGMKPSRYSYTPGGHLAHSGYERLFYIMLENYNIEFIPKAYYKDFIPRMKNNYEFDGIVWVDNKMYFIEIFGIINNLGDYDKKTNEKIGICRENNIPLIDIFPNVFEENNTEEKLYHYLMKRIETTPHYELY